MKIREARTTKLLDKAYDMKGSEVMQAFFYIANSADIARMADIMEVEEAAQKLKRVTDKMNG